MGAVVPSSGVTPESAMSDVTNGLRKWKFHFDTVENGDAWSGVIGDGSSSAFANTTLVDVGTVNVTGTSPAVGVTPTSGIFGFTIGGTVTGFDLIFWTAV